MMWLRRQSSLVLAVPSRPHDGPYVPCHAYIVIYSDHRCNGSRFRFILLLLCHTIDRKPSFGWRGGRNHRRSQPLLPTWIPLQIAPSSTGSVLPASPPGRALPRPRCSASTWQWLRGKRGKRLICERSEERSEREGWRDRESCRWGLHSPQQFSTCLFRSALTRRSPKTGLEKHQCNRNSLWIPSSHTPIQIQK